MKVHLLQKETQINARLDEVWNFFSSPHNLFKITPPYMGFKVKVCPDVPHIFEGMLIEYRVSPLLNIPLKWITEIKEVKGKISFVDRQLKGPFSLWEHTHTFRAEDDTVHMTDLVRYAVPFGFLGNIAHALFVKKQVQDIFVYREEIIGQLFPSR